MFLAIPVFLACAAAWYFPVYKKQGLEGKVSTKTLVLAFVLGVLAMPVSILFATPYSLPATYIFHITGYTRQICDSIFLAGVCEELGKFFLGWLIIRKLRPVRKIDAILVFGMVGMGFEVAESIMMIENLFGACFRGVQALHILWLFWIGAYWWESRKCKANGDKSGARWNLFIAFFVPMFTHATNDALIDVIMHLAKSEDETKAMIAVLLLAVILIMTIVFDVKAEKLAIRTSKESQGEVERI